MHHVRKCYVATEHMYLIYKQQLCLQHINNDTCWFVSGNRVYIYLIIISPTTMTMNVNMKWKHQLAATTLKI
jgi:hypothetical protein